MATNLDGLPLAHTVRPQQGQSSLPLVPRLLLPRLPFAGRMAPLAPPSWRLLRFSIPLRFPLLLRSLPSDGKLQEGFTAAKALAIQSAKSSWFQLTMDKLPLSTLPGPSTWLPRQWTSQALPERMTGTLSDPPPLLAPLLWRSGSLRVLLKVAPKVARPPRERAKAIIVNSPLPAYCLDTDAPP